MSNIFRIPHEGVAENPLSLDTCRRPLHLLMRSNLRLEENSELKDL